MTDPIGARIEHLFDAAVPPLSLGELGTVRPVAPALRRVWPAVAGLAVVAVAVGLMIALFGPPGPLEPTTVCVDPPASELSKESPLAITLEPNPVRAGTQATLTVDAEVGVPADWQCWDGEQWVLTHYLMRGYATEEYHPGSTITFPDMGIPAGQPSQVVIPDVAPGTYRILDKTVQQTEVFVFVRVADVVAPTTTAAPPTSSAPTTTTTVASTTTLSPPEENIPFDPGPLQARGGHSVVWTGEEMIVWGGSADFSSWTWFADGAAFAPATNTWRTISPAPLEPRVHHHAVWTGSEMLVVGGSGLINGAAYDPVSDTWRSIADMPADLPFLDPFNRESSAVWTGEQLVVWSVRGDIALSYSPEEDAWHVLPGVGVNADSGVLRWTGQEVIALGRASRGPGFFSLRAFRLQDDEWVAARSGGGSLQAGLSAWDGHELVAWSVYGTSEAFQPESGTWEWRDPAPFEECFSLDEPTEMGNRGVLVSCDVQGVYQDGLWTVVQLDGVAEARYSVWTGSEVLTWGSADGQGDQPFEVRAWRWTPPD